jgi:hypothetical protein
MNVLGATQNVDVVDEELDVAWVTQHAGENTDGDADAYENEQMGKRVPVRRPKPVLEQVKQPDVGGAHEAANDACDRDVRQETPLRSKQAFDEQLTRAPKPEAPYFHIYIVVRATFLYATSTTFPSFPPRLKWS